MSRRKSSSDQGRSQSALSTISAPVGPSKSRKRPSCRRWRSTLAATDASSSRGRSSDRPLGSPISPVPPPITTIGLPPARWRCASSITGTRLPTWRLGAVGSKPTYPVTGPRASRARRPGVSSWIRPRCPSSSRSASWFVVMGVSVYPYQGTCTLASGSGPHYVSER